MRPISIPLLICTLLVLAVAGSAPMVAEAVFTWDLCSALPQPISEACYFSGFLNVPIDAELSLDEENHLVVCNTGAAEFGVSFIIPTTRSGHEDWIDLGLSEIEQIDDPNTLTDAVVKSTSDAKYDGSRVQVQAYMRDMVDTEVDCDGSSNSGASCLLIVNGFPLDAMGPDTLDIFPSDDSPDGQPLCADSLVNPSLVVVDTNNNCADGANGVRLVGSSSLSSGFEVTSFWAFNDIDGDDLLDDGENLYIDVTPARQFQDTDSVVAITTDYRQIGSQTVTLEILNCVGGNLVHVTDVTGQDVANHPALAEEWPVWIEFSRFRFVSFQNCSENPVPIPIALPGMDPILGVELGIRPESSDHLLLSGTAKVTTKANDNVRQTIKSKGIDLCADDNQFTVIRESLGSNPILTQVIPALPGGGMLLLIVLVIGAGGYLLSRRTGM